MNIRLAVVSTDRNTNKILQKLKTLYSDELEVVLHLGGVADDFKASTISRLNNRRGVKGHLFENQRWTGAAQKLMETPDFVEKTEEFIDQLHRTSENTAFRSHPIKTMADYADFYHITADVIAQKLIDGAVNMALFFNVPHLTYDLILYQTAKSLGIKTLIVTQSLFPNYFLSLKNVEDIGNVNLTKKGTPYPIKKDSHLKLFYMNSIKQEHEEAGTISFKGICQFIIFLLFKRPLAALNLFYVFRLVKHMKKIYGKFPKWRDPFASFFHEDSLAYFDHLATFENQTLDLKGDFVYFPLQFQPEMTTSALGGKFRDQAYAIERLANVLPSNFRILVKENPKQGAYMRGPMFFHRLKRIPNVTFLPSWASTHILTEKARFVATITGTVGWEAIRQGKPALVFGKAWYRKFEGVHEWRDDITCAEIIATKINHATLEENVGSFLAQAHKGVFDRHYIQLVENFDIEKNSVQSAKILFDLLTDAQETTFYST